MHELPVTESILNVALTHAKKNQVQKITAIHLQVGELSDLEDEWMQRYFDYLSKDSIAAGARLVIERTPVIMQCEECPESFHVDLKSENEIVCPACKGKNCKLVSGRGYFVKSMEVI
ncbi:MAG: hydrogenase maturation nickel metallochaperone HypA [Desulfobacterales bacterium]